MKVIFFEGAPGTGKTTQFHRSDSTGPVAYERFPTRSTYGQAANQASDPTCAALCHAADFRSIFKYWRSQSSLPAFVICDQGPLSVMAGEGYARKIGYDKLKPIFDLAMQGVNVAATIIFYAPFKTCVNRIEMRDGVQLEQEELDTITRTWQAYEHFRLGNRSDDEFARREFMDGWQAWTGELHFIDATQTEDEIQAQVETIVKNVTNA